MKSSKAPRIQTTGETILFSVRFHTIGGRKDGILRKMKSFEGNGYAGYKKNSVVSAERFMFNDQLITWGKLIFSDQLITFLVLDSEILVSMIACRMKRVVKRRI